MSRTAPFISHLIGGCAIFFAHINTASSQVGGTASQVAADFPAPPDYGSSLLKITLLLVLICVGAWLAIRWIKKKKLSGFSNSERVKIIDKKWLDAKNVLYVVEVDAKQILLSVGEQGPARFISTLDEEVHQKLKSHGPSKEG